MAEGCLIIALSQKKWQTEHRTATTAYPCCLPTLGEFSRSWSCRFAAAKINASGVVGGKEPKILTLAMTGKLGYLTGQRFLCMILKR